MSDQNKINNGFTILNAEGDIWTPEYFSSEKKAHDSISRFCKAYDTSLPRHTIVPAIFTITLEK